VYTSCRPQPATANTFTYRVGNSMLPPAALGRHWRAKTLPVAPACAHTVLAAVEQHLHTRALHWLPLFAPAHLYLSCLPLRCHSRRTYTYARSASRSCRTVPTLRTTTAGSLTVLPHISRGEPFATHCWSFFMHTRTPSRRGWATPSWWARVTLQHALFPPLPSGVRAFARYRAL